MPIGLICTFFPKKSQISFYLFLPSSDTNNKAKNFFTLTSSYNDINPCQDPSPTNILCVTLQWICVTFQFFKNKIAVITFAFFLLLFTAINAWIVSEHLCGLPIANSNNNLAFAIRGIVLLVVVVLEFFQV